MDAAAVFESGDERDVGDGRGENLTADREDFAADANGFGEVASDVSQRGEKEVAEVVADEAAAGVKTVLKEATEESFVLAESDHAVTDVAGRKDAIFAAKAAGTAAVVRDSDDRGEAGDRMFAFDFVAAAGDEILEAAQKSGKTGAAAESDDVESCGGSLWLGDVFLHDRVTMRFRTTVLHATLHPLRTSLGTSQRQEPRRG